MGPPEGLGDVPQRSHGKDGLEHLLRLHEGIPWVSKGCSERRAKGTGERDALGPPTEGIRCLGLSIKGWSDCATANRVPGTHKIFASQRIWLWAVCGDTPWSTLGGGLAKFLVPS